jgi:hypothetical protein
MHWARLQRLSATDTLEGVSGQTSPDQRWELYLDPISTIPQEGHTVERQHRGDSYYSALATVGVERKSIHASSCVDRRGMKAHEQKRSLAQLVE